MSESPLAVSPYEVLGVPPSAGDDDLRRAYRRRLRETHPDTGGDADAFARVQRAWSLVGTADARAAYDRGRAASGPGVGADTGSGSGGGFGSSSSSGTVFEGYAAPAGGWRPPAREHDTRPRARTHGHPGGWRRERYLALIREWAGRGAELEDPYDEALVRSAPREIRHLLADAHAEEATARIVAELGMGYTVWHDVLAPTRSADPEAKVDHIVLGPSGLYAVASEDYGGPVRVRRGELVADDVSDPLPVHLVGRAKAVGRAAGVRFSGAIIVLPDDDVPAAIDPLGKTKGLPVVLVGRSALSTILRRGIDGAHDIGGTEAFEIRTRLQQTIQFV